MKTEKKMKTKSKVLLLATTIVGLSALVVGLVSNTASAQDAEQTKVVPGVPITKAISAKSAIELGKEGLTHFLGEDVDKTELISCVKASVQGVIGVDIENDKYEEDFERSKNGNVSITDGTKTVVLTPAIRSQMREAMVGCFDGEFVPAKQLLETDEWFNGTDLS